MSQLADIQSHVPIFVSQACAKLWQQGISCVAVGGIPRDILTGRFPLTDWDFEVRPRDGNSDNFEDRLKSALGEQGHELGFGVYRCTMEDGTELEFSIPRAESFSVDAVHLKRKALGHKDVSFELDPSLSYEESFKRRDLSINAIGLEYNDGQWSWIDPYQGREDLQNLLARPCSPNFVFDPVRILRALRFKQLFQLSFSRELESLFELANLSLATDHYFLYESMKGGFFPFMRDFFALIKKYQIDTPETWQELSFLGDSQLPAMFYSTDQLLLRACWQGEWLLSDMGKLERFLKLRRGRAKHFLTAKEMALEFMKYDWATVVTDWRQSTWPDILEDELFGTCHEMHKHWESWTPQEEQELLVDQPQMTRGLKDWREFFPRQFKGLEKFQQNQSVDEVAPAQRSHYRLWCHVISG